MYYLVRTIWLYLASKFGHRYFIVYEWVCKTEYQGRGTPHWHIACWVLCFGILDQLKGRTGTAIVSAFVKFLELVFRAEIDVQVGNGRLNYINGYVSKDHDAVDVGLGEYVQKEATAPWLATYRLLSKTSPCIPEVAIRMAQLSEFERSYSHVLLYPPQPAAMLEHAGRLTNFSTKMYGIYLQEKRTSGLPISENFLVWHRTREYDRETGGYTERGGRHQQMSSPTLVVACRYWYELTDGFWGQFSVTQIPHLYPAHLLPLRFKHLKSMQNFVGIIEYMCNWVWAEPDTIMAATETLFPVTALPMRIDDAGAVQPLGTYLEKGAVFPSDRHAFEYLMSLAERDLQYRGMRDDRLACFRWKQEANFLLYERVTACEDDAEYELLRQSWDTINRPKYRNLKWGPKQEEAFQKIHLGISYEDEQERQSNRRWLYIAGAPGSGKSAVILEAAVRAAQSGQVVLIVCPTGLLVHFFKSQLPEVDGIENVRVDTLQGVLQYKRPGKDQKVRWAPPSALRRIDLILVDEGSQYDDKEWERFFQCIKEQPHSPFCAVIADFQQLQPVVAGGRCKAFCDMMESVVLDTVYRSTDEDHLLFINRIRTEQPTRRRVMEYFGERHWSDYTLDESVAYGMELAEKTKDGMFYWLTSTNRGASEVCAAALRCIGVAKEAEKGYLCDPATKSTLRILAKKGVLIRLSRNFDKQRGFVNGAYAVIEDALRGNAVFTARLIGTGNMVLVHPMEEEGSLFLPCCYGYATTIRRAQGSSLDLGCLYFDQRRHHAGRGYGYVGVSRFRTRAGCFLYGKLRQTDFLPVGDEKEDEVLERGVESETSDEDEIGMEHIGMDNVFQDGVLDPFEDIADDAPTDMTDFGEQPPVVAEAGPVVKHKEAKVVLDADFDFKPISVLPDEEDLVDEAVSAVVDEAVLPADFL